MKLVFLDCDGVLNCSTTTEVVFLRARPGIPYIGLDKRIVPRLNEIVLRSGAKIVISSTWRVHHTLEEMKLLLVEAGMDPSIELIGATPNLHVHRYLEIRKFLDWMTVPPTHFVILDDLEEAGVGLGAHFVQTDGGTGLTDVDVVLALAILGASVAE